MSLKAEIRDIDYKTKITCESYIDFFLSESKEAEEAYNKHYNKPVGYCPEINSDCKPNCVCYGQVKIAQSPKADIRVWLPRCKKLWR